MTKNLRKRHLQIWSMLMVLVPVSIVSARLATPKQPVENLLQPTATSAYANIIQTVRKENYIINLRESKDSNLQLEWINKNILTVPTATIYKVAIENNDIKNGLLIGRIEARGTYRFALGEDFMPRDSSPCRLILYDFIHEQVIDTIQLNK